MALDGATRELFVADTGADRIVRVLTDTGSFSRDAKLAANGHEAYAVYSSPEVTVSRRAPPALHPWCL